MTRIYDHELDMVSITVVTKNIILVTINVITNKYKYLYVTRVYGHKLDIVTITVVTKDIMFMTMDVVINRYLLVTNISHH